MDLKYLKQFETLCEQLNNNGFDINLEMKGNKYLCKHTNTMYVMFHLERVRVERLSKEIDRVVTDGFDSMYQLGLERGLECSLGV